MGGRGRRWARGLQAERGMRDPSSRPPHTRPSANKVP